MEDTLNYMLLIYLDEAWTGRPLAERQRLYEEQVKFTQDLGPGARYLAGSPLHPPSQGRTVRVRDGKPLLTDGPFAETREHLGGYMLIEADSLEHAVALATRAPLARVGTIEVRPVRQGPPAA